MKSARLLALLALSTVSVFAGIKSERQLAAIIDHTPAARLVADGQQLKSAEAAAAAIPGAEAFWGIGESMEPLYATNTAIVVSPIAYDDVKKGMTVVYVKSNGRRVAHSIVGETRGGYLVQGVNNDEPDAEIVSEKNLIGVITAAYATADSQFTPRPPPASSRRARSSPPTAPEPLWPPSGRGFSLSGRSSSAGRGPIFSAT